MGIFKIYYTLNGHSLTWEVQAQDKSHACLLFDNEKKYDWVTKVEDITTEPNEL